ncbi:zinc ribbon domain-containing protein [archaeon]|nr:zinc ribbon domain-containing protein [archaeon]
MSLVGHGPSPQMLLLIALIGTLLLFVTMGVTFTRVKMDLGGGDYLMVELRPFTDSKIKAKIYGQVDTETTDSMTSGDWSEEENGGITPAYGMYMLPLAGLVGLFSLYAGWVRLRGEALPVSVSFRTLMFAVSILAIIALIDGLRFTSSLASAMEDMVGLDTGWSPGVGVFLLIVGWLMVAYTLHKFEQLPTTAAPARPTATCPNCGSPVSPEAAFCPVCGAQITGAAPAARTCPQCGSVVPEGSAFCPTCGASLAAPPPAPSAQYCPHCGKQVPPGVAFCPYCGNRVSG